MLTGVVAVLAAALVVLRRRRRGRPVDAGRAARLRWAVLRHGDTVVLTNRGSTSAVDVRVGFGPDEDPEVGAGDAVELGTVGPGAGARVVRPLTPDTLWATVTWTDPRHGPSASALRTDVFPRQER